MTDGWHEDRGALYREKVRDTIMTLPHERTRAVIATEKFLMRLASDDDMPPEVRREAEVLLRHYPMADEVKLVGRKEVSQGAEGLCYQVFSEFERF